jgi:hypothetical protein
MLQVAIAGRDFDFPFRGTLYLVLTMPRYWFAARSI